MIRTLIVDDQFLIREGLKSLLQTAAEIELVGLAKDGAEALAAIASDDPDVVLLDINLPDIDGLQIAQQVNAQSPQVKIIMLSSYDSEEYVLKAMDAGARGYLLKTVSEQELEWSIKLVYQGYSAFKSELLSNLNLPNPNVSDFARESSKHQTTPDTASSPAHKSSGQTDHQISSTIGDNRVADTPIRSMVMAQSGIKAELNQDDQEFLLAKKRFQENYKTYRQQRPQSRFHSVNVTRTKKTMMSFEFKLLVFIILFSLGFLVFVALS